MKTHKKHVQQFRSGKTHTGNTQAINVTYRT